MLLPRHQSISALRKALNLLVFAAGLQASLFAGERPRAEAAAVTERVLARALIVDTHADTIGWLMQGRCRLDDPASSCMISIPKMRQGHLAAEFFSIWVSTTLPSREYVPGAVAEFEAVHQQVERFPNDLGVATTADEIVRLHEQGKIAILMGVEGGHTISDNLLVLGAYYRLGARYMTLTHTAHTSWADSSKGKPRSNGLTDFGRSVVREMNRLGMMVDISHVSDKTFADALAVTRAPLIASHSSCRALAHHSRNLTDDMIRALAKNGGVIQINFYSPFIDDTFAAALKKLKPKMDAEVALARAARKRERKQFTNEDEVMIRRRYAPQLPILPMERIADHIDHAVKVGGVDHVGLGSDFDGVDFIPRGMEDASKLPDLVRELARRGYSEEDLLKILGGNILRVLRDVERVSREMQSGK
ncbi:MAG: membrane dipeptidase [Acidobacteria bacterium]|nr:membrane dipeptidase [Acidobacteriota bacterium]